MNKLDISVVVPLYNEAESLPELVAWIDRVAAEHGYTYEVILVSSSRWMPTCRIRPTRFPNCAG